MKKELGKHRTQNDNGDDGSPKWNYPGEGRGPPDPEDSSNVYDRSNDEYDAETLMMLEKSDEESAESYITSDYDKDEKRHRKLAPSQDKRIRTSKDSQPDMTNEEMRAYRLQRQAEVINNRKERKRNMAFLLLKIRKLLSEFEVSVSGGEDYWTYDLEEVGDSEAIIDLDFNIGISVDIPIRYDSVERIVKADDTLELEYVVFTALANSKQPLADMRERAMANVRKYEVAMDIINSMFSAEKPSMLDIKYSGHTEDQLDAIANEEYGEGYGYLPS